MKQCNICPSTEQVLYCVMDVIGRSKNRCVCSNIQTFSMVLPRHNNLFSHVVLRKCIVISCNPLLLFLSFSAPFSNPSSASSFSFIPSPAHISVLNCFSKECGKMIVFNNIFILLFFMAAPYFLGSKYVNEFLFNFLLFNFKIILTITFRLTITNKSS